MPETTMTVGQLRQELPLTQNIAYFQTGTHGLTPDSVTDLVYEQLQFLNHQGIYIPDVRRVLNDRENAALAKLAACLQVQPRELAWTSNSTHGLHSVLHSIRWQPGDEFIVSSAEHASTQGACRILQRDFGVVIKTIPAEDGDDALLTRLASAVTNNTRLVCVSQVSCRDGRRLPVAEAARIAHTLDIPVLVDGAQAIGQYAINVAAIGCDFYIGSCHKWLLGTKGLGFIWIAPERIDTFHPYLIPDDVLKGGETQPSNDAASRIEFGTHDYAIRIGMNRTLEIIAALGLERIEAHSQRLADILSQEIEQWPLVKLVSPVDRRHRTGLLALTFDGYDLPKLRKLVADLLKAQIVVKPQPELPAMRISLAAFNTEDEVHYLLDVLKRLVG